MVLRKDIIGLLLVIFAEVARAFSIPFWKRQIVSDTNIAEKALFFQKGVFKPKGHKESPTVVHNNANSVVHPTQLRSHKFQTAHQNRINHLPVYPLKVTNNIDHTKIDIEELAIGLDTDESFLERESDTVHDEITCPITNSAAFVPFQLTRRKVTEQGGKISSDDAALELSGVNVDVAVSTIETDQCRIVPVSTEEFYDSVASTRFLHSFANQLNDKTAADTRSLNPLMWMMSQHSGVDLSAAPDLSNTIFVSEPNGNNSTATYIPEPILSLSQPLSQSTGQVSISKSTVDLSYLALFCFLLGVVSTYVSGRAISTFRTWYANRMPRFIAQLEKRAIQLLNTGQYEQVKALLSKEVPRIAQYRGALHVDTAAFRHFLGKALLALKECGPAEQQLVQVVEAYELFGEDLYMAHALEDLALSQQTILVSIILFEYIFRFFFLFQFSLHFRMYLVHVIRLQK